MSDFQATWRGLLQTQLGIPTSGQQEAPALASEWCRRLILNGTNIDANGILHFGLSDFDMSEVLEGNVTIAGTLNIDGVAGFSTNLSVNTVTFVADTIGVGSNISFLQGMTVQGGYPGIQFANNTHPPDVRVARVFTGQMAMVANAGGGFGMNTENENFARIFMLNDAGGIGFGNGTNAVDTYLSRLGQDQLAVGAGGYGSSNGYLQLHGLGFANSASGFQASLVQAGSNGVNFNAGDSGFFGFAKIGDTFARVVISNDGSGIAFANGTNSVDVRIKRVFTGQLLLEANAGGSLSFATFGENNARLLLLNDAGGVGFANGNASPDAYLSRVSPGVLGAGLTGYGTTDAQFSANVFSGNVANLVTCNTQHLIVADANVSANIGGAALTAGQSNTANVTITGVTTGHVIVVTPVVDVGSGFGFYGYCSNTNIVTVKVWCAVAGTPTSTAFNVRVIR